MARKPRVQLVHSVDFGSCSNDALDFIVEDGFGRQLLFTLSQAKRAASELDARDANWRRPVARRRMRMNPSADFTVYHADHGINEAQLDYIEETLVKSAPQGFFIKEVRFPKRLGTVPNALYGPDSGDAPVPESVVHYMDRSGRGWEDRMVDMPHRPTNKVQCIGVRDGRGFTMYTIYGGPLAPQNPNDPNNPDPVAAKKWWSQHALSSQQWKK